MNKLIAEGKTKQIFTTENENVVKIHYTNHTTALNGKREEDIDEKGSLNNRISSLIFTYLAKNGVSTCFLEKLSENEQLDKKLTMIPLEVVVRNFASGSFQRKFNTEYLAPLANPVQEFFMKSDELDDPFMNNDQIKALNIVDDDQIKTMHAMALKINDLLSDLFYKANIMLVDFKVEFGVDSDGNIVLGDEISPDSCRLVDKSTKKSLDKDVFRKNLGNLVDGYKTVLARLEAEAK
ncbi:phosphoribosylaminoimidazolesuccinocarboxamide synthase [Apilactobacillus sp. M161]|uniref:Phosphoribosylaminoimidazole-succinocarboxamide synthase n=1 Tax=Apilactobacillus xinyiensis TaxID=2841032 RepID=A0ABT0I185_9LACO|nr:phosphoribosylaminoimidazolesuccinocarboxamide synthase [Apilactobacillus xinyiensis]MCK8624267.1 phosphoribosylaminoimidazolesuccinocarboxamide synthase [Apilactobacillus xinyiensis]